jgi:hypothetical protein
MHRRKGVWTVEKDMLKFSPLLAGGKKNTYPA